jgi:hypothetical protein
MEPLNGCLLWIALNQVCQVCDGSFMTSSDNCRQEHQGAGENSKGYGRLDNDIKTVEMNQDSCWGNPSLSPYLNLDANVNSRERIGPLG